MLAPMIQSRALTRLWRTLYGDIDGDELPRIMWLSALLCCIIGGFWLLDSLKDTVLATTVGLEHQPKAKAIPVLVTLVVVAAFFAVLAVGAVMLSRARRDGSEQ